MKQSVRALLVMLILVGVTSLAFAQGAGNVRSSIGGTVTDTSGGVIPGATVTIKNTDTSVKTELVTTSAGTFFAPALDPGNYEITVSLSGFKTSVTKDVKIVPSIPYNAVIKIEVGSVSETVNVSARSSLVNTTTPTVTNTLVSQDLVNLPLLTHNALYALTLLPGVDQTAANPRANTTIAGLPASSISITIDGVNTNNNQDRNGDGFYSMVFPHLDAIEQVSLTTANSDAAGASQGAVQVKFVTKSGSNTYKGTAYNYYRDKKLNSNYIFNIYNGLPRNDISANQFGASEGGPIVIPGLIDGRGKAFFFFNMEEFHQPIAPTRNRVMLSELAMQGIFSCTGCGPGGIGQVNLLTLGGSNDTIDPTIQALLTQIDTGAKTTGKITPSTNLNLRNYVYQPNGNYIQHLPTSKVDFNLTPGNRLSGSYLFQINNRLPDIQNSTETRFPGLTAGARYTSKRTVGSITLRSTLSNALVNELVGGWQWSPGCFQCDLSPSMFDSQGGFNLGFPTLSNTAVTSATGTGTREAPRNTPNWNLDDNVTWIRGAHSFGFGLSYSDYYYTQKVNVAVPTITFGVQQTLDPADALFTTGNFIPTSEAANARALYAFLTGRVTTIGATGRLDSDGHYQYPPQQGISHSWELKEWGTYAQDTWRLTPTVTVNAGVRWEIQMPLQARVPNYQTASLADACGVSGLGNGTPIAGAPSFINQCNIFKPGTLTGSAPHYAPLKPHTNAYNTSWGNVAPNLGVAWRPNVQNGWLRKILGDPEQATIRGGYSIAYDRSGFTDLANVFANNGGQTVGANRTNNNANLVLPGESWPVLFRDRARLGPPAKCAEGANPVPVSCMAFSPLQGQLVNLTSINLFDPNIHIASARSFSIGLQRALTRTMAVEVQYIGTRRADGWDTNDWNEVNIIENGFLDEFKVAQQNLIANQAAGLNSFAFTTNPGTRPLPIFLASYLGLAGCVSAGCPGANNTSSYTGANWTNTTVINALSFTQPNPATLSSGGGNGLYGNATFRANGQAAGLPANFWVMNPQASSVNITSNALRSKYDSLQLILRSRLSHGMTLQSSFTTSVTKTSALDSTGINPGALHRDYVFLPSTTGVPKSFKMQMTYDLPVGRSRRFGTNMAPWLDAVAGGWSWGMTGQVRTGRVFTLSQVKLVGMSKDELQKEFYIRVDPTTKIVTSMDADIILNTRRAFTSDGSLGVPTGRYIAPAATAGCIDLYPGDCGEPRRIDLTGPKFVDFDMNIKKTFFFGAARKQNFQIEGSAVNVFNAKNFTAVLNASNSATLDQVTAAYNDIGNTFNPGGRVGQIVVRFNW